MKKILVCLAVILLLLMVSGRDEPNVPILSVISDGQKTEALSCGYRLTYRSGWFQKTSVVADCAGVDEVAESLEGVKVSPGETLNFEFDQRMDQFFILDWHQEMELDAEGEIIVPTEAGTYVYGVTTYWGENEATYVIKVVVE